MKKVIPVYGVQMQMSQEVIDWAIAESHKYNLDVGMVLNALLYVAYEQIAEEEVGKVIDRFYDVIDELQSSIPGNVVGNEEHDDAN